MVLIRYIIKDVNKVLLFLTIVPIILFIALGVNYENTIKNVKDEYNKNLEEVTGNLDLQKLNETNKLKETSLQAKEMLLNENAKV